MELRSLIRAWEMLMAEELERLEVDEAKPEMTGVHPEFGRVSARQLLATWAFHDLGHVAQIARTMAARYTTEAEPWRAYLPVLRPRNVG